MPSQLADERQRAERLATERDKAVSELAAARETLARKSIAGFSPTRRLSPRGTQPVGLISIAVDDLHCLFFRTLVKHRVKLAFTEVGANEVVDPILVKWLEFCH